MYVDSAAEEEHVFPITPWNHFLENIDRDLSFWKKPVQSLRSLKKKGNLLQGKSIYVHESAQVFGASLDATDGPVVIDAEAKISSFCHLKGPLYIGEKTQVDMAFLSNCVIGENCRIGGEVADSLISNYTNKHHEGFVGHSILGSWANLGALTTTSDLKNNYRPVKLLFQKQEFPTGELKYGSILGDFVKTSIGTMLNTGTVIDLGVLLPPKQEQKKYYPPFSWGGYPDEFYELQKFFRDIETMMQRRNQVLTAFLKDELAKIYALNFRA
ncbi:MAG: glucose-1-phosphate thymidylyltransferase [Candidatus Hydrogenedentota bacterium]|nr:MAG: glucose-1-phosphate thymidylyltransferase [Candidatus Hydrogenedentota bacterium]